MKSQAQEFVHCFAARIRPPGQARAAEHDVVIFMEGDRFAFAVNFAARSDEDFSAEFIGDIQHDFGAANVCFYRMDRIFGDQLDADSGSQMENYIALLDQRFYLLGIADVAFDKLEAGMIFKTFDIFQTAGAEIIDDRHFITIFEQPFGQMRPDKTRSTCN
jgi:hypothetical protein